MDSKITLSTFGQKTRKTQEKQDKELGGFYCRRRKDAPSAHIPLAGTQSTATLYCEKSGNGSTLCLGGRELRVVMSAKFRKLH